jgi:hypothetical protein
MTPPPASAARLRAGVAAPAPLRLPPAPRRVSGPATRTPPAERSVSGLGGLFIRVIDHPWLERLVRGRAWIAIVATALLGIVAMQVALLRLGSQVGAQTAEVNALTQRNNAIVATIGGIEANGGLGTSASSLGMLYPPPGALTYLQPSPGQALRAAERMQAPSAAASAAAAAHPPRLTTTSTASKTPATNTAGTQSSIAGGASVSSVGATGAAGTALTTTGAGQTSATNAAGGSAGANAATSSTSANTNGTSTTTQRTTATGTPPPTPAAGGVAATTAAGGTSAATTGAISGASVAPGATSAGG